MMCHMNVDGVDTNLHGKEVKKRIKHRHKICEQHLTLSNTEALTPTKVCVF